MGNASGKPISFAEQVNLNHFRLLRVVGKGAFGKVRIVERKDTGLTFALKYIRKDEGCTIEALAQSMINDIQPLVRSESVRNIIRERRMLEHLNHAFLCNLRYSFQDVEYLYLIVDLMNGGDLRFHISRKAFTEDAVCFWMAELGCALRYIHSQGVIHRDLKPDNVLLDSDGHVHLADFNVASEYRPSKPLHSKSGTLAYLAPEVYAGCGYMTEVDWWSLGITFYECIYNKRPFMAHGHEKLQAEILRASASYPLTQPPISTPCLHAISALLEKDVARRIGARSFESFAEHAFFRKIDFVQLEKKQIPPIFVPSSDKTNFDATYDLEELLLEEAPLEARARRQKPRTQLKDDATEKEIRIEELHRMIETLFEPFDYTKVTDYKGFVDAPESSSLDFLEQRTMAAGGVGTTSELSGNASPVASLSRPAVHSPVIGPSSLTQSPSLQRIPSSAESPSGHTFDTARSSPVAPSATTFEDVSRRPSNPIVPHRQRLAPSKSDHQGISCSPTDGNASAMGRRQRSHTTADSSHVAELGSWSDSVPPPAQCIYREADGDAPQTSKDDASRSGSVSVFTKPSSVRGFLNRKKGRDRSPKPQEPGVLGKEGARVVITGR